MMQIDKLKIDATTINFFDDYIVEDKRKIVKKDIETVVTKYIKKLIKLGKL